MQEKKWNILVVDDNEDILLSLRLLLQPYSNTIRTTPEPKQIPAFLKAENFDVILLDMNFTKDAISGIEGFQWIREILKLDNDAAVVCITAYGDTEKAVQAIKYGASDFILKPWINDKLIATIASAVRLRNSKKETTILRNKQEELTNSQHNAFDEFIGKSECMQHVFSIIEQVAKTDASILILGENGTGKELVARSTHKLSERKDDIFVSVDLGSINENLFESELFGYVKGAFTDAKRDKAGKFEVANGGTLFLDEIGNLSPAMQSKLLTVLEKREVTRVGSHKAIPLDVRIICATNADLEKLIASGDFREDLYYRINTVEIDLPPLRDRGNDIKLLAEHFIKLFAKKYKKNISDISKDAIGKLVKHPWPGNVRELRHVMERTVIMAKSENLHTNDFLLKASSLRNDKQTFDTHNLDEIEKNIIEKVIRLHNGNITKVAKELGLSRAALYRRMEKHDL